MITVISWEHFIEGFLTYDKKNVCLSIDNLICPYYTIDEFLVKRSGLTEVDIMRLSTKGRYGLKAMFDLAMNYGENPVSLTTIAARQGVSVNYLEQLISPLRKAGFVRSVRGAQGGYLLNVSPEEITVKEVLVVLEGPLAPTDCVKDEQDSSCDNANYCVTRLIYEKK